VPLVRLADGYVLQVHSVPASTQVGQSFLLDTNLARQWTKTAAGSGSHFLLRSRLIVAWPDTIRPGSCWESPWIVSILLGLPAHALWSFPPMRDDTAKLVNEWLSARPAD